MFLSVRATAVLFAVALVCMVVARGETPSSAGADLSGSWENNHYLSDHPAQILRAIRLDTGLPLEESTQFDHDRRSANLSRGVMAVGPNQQALSRVAPDFLSVEERKKVGVLFHNAQFAPTTISITQTGDAITFTQFGASETFSTTGKAEEHALDGGAVKHVAKWEGSTLVITYTVGQAGAVTYRYILVPKTKQLLIQVNFERSSGEAGPFEIRLVYDRATDSRVP